MNYSKRKRKRKKVLKSKRKKVLKNTKKKNLEKYKPKIKIKNMKGGVLENFRAVPPNVTVFTPRQTEAHYKKPDYKSLDQLPNLIGMKFSLSAFPHILVDINKLEKLDIFSLAKLIRYSLLITPQDKKILLNNIFPYCLGHISLRDYDYYIPEDYDFTHHYSDDNQYPDLYFAAFEPRISFNIAISIEKFMGTIGSLSSRDRESPDNFHLDGYNHENSQFILANARQIPNYDYIKHKLVTIPYVNYGLMHQETFFEEIYGPTRQRRLHEESLRQGTLKIFDPVRLREAAMAMAAREKKKEEEEEEEEEELLRSRQSSQRVMTHGRVSTRRQPGWFKSLNDEDQDRVFQQLITQTQKFR